MIKELTLHAFKVYYNYYYMYFLNISFLSDFILMVAPYIYALRDTHVHI